MTRTYTNPWGRQVPLPQPATVRPALEAPPGRIRARTGDIPGKGWTWLPATAVTEQQRPAARPSRAALIEETNYRIQENHR